MAEQADAGVEYTPVGRYSHVAATVDSKLYVWGGWRKDTPSVHDGQEKNKLTSLVEVLDLKEMEWSVQYTKGDPPLGVAWCAYTVVGERIIIYGGYCQHDYCYHNTLHELDTSQSILTWRQLAAGDAFGAPMKKWNCGLVAYSENPEKLAVFGGYGELKQSQPHSEYIKNEFIPANSGCTNEIHCFMIKSGKWSSPEVKGERPPPILGFSYAKISEHEVAMFGGYAMKGANSRSGRINDLYILKINDTQVHCTRVVKPAGEVPWPIERSHQASCVLANPLTGHKNTHILSVGGEKNSWDKQSKCTGETLSDVWIGEYSKDRKTTWKQVFISEPQLIRIKRQRHSATVCRLDTSHVIVVVHGGVEVMVRDERIAQHMDMLADTSILEFELHDVHGNEVWALTRAIDLTYYQKIKQRQSRSFTTQHSIIGAPSCPLTMKMLLHYQRDGEEEPVRIIDEVAPNWKNLGTFLNFAESELDSILKQHSKPEECCKDMLAKWLAGYNDSKHDASPVTWETLLKAIKDARWGVLARKIETFVYTE